MATKTSTETRREITRKGDLVIVKVVETTTTHAPGKEPEVKEITRVEEFKGEEGMKRLPEDIRRQLEQPAGHSAVAGPVDKRATRGNFAEECLAEHNKYRERHGAGPLRLSEELMAVSEERAAELARKDEMSSRRDQRYGENLSCLWSSDPQHFVEAGEIVSRWYSEGKSYEFGEEPSSLSAGHFTQMVWASTRELGVAAAKSESNKIYVVATYSPPGNYAGEFRKNVVAAGSKPNVMATSARASCDSLNAKSATPDATPPEDLNTQCVDIHNRYRARHGVPPLRYSKEVAAHAQHWADELARHDKFEHSTDRKYGENLYCFKSSDPRALATAEDACTSWYAEIQQHDFSTEPRSLATGHFTQMVWKTTAEVGMGRARSRSGLQIIVANYNPPGNYIGNFRENVLRPK